MIKNICSTCPILDFSDCMIQGEAYEREELPLTKCRMKHAVDALSEEMYKKGVWWARAHGTDDMKKKMKIELRKEIRKEMGV